MLRILIMRGNEGYDVSESFESAVWGGRKGSAPRYFKIKLIDDDGERHKRIEVDCEDGDQCVVYYKDKEIFRGLIEKHTQGRNKMLDIVAYDNMYYLANNKDSFSYQNKTATQIFQDIMQRSGMQAGEVSDTAYVIPELPKSKTTYYDVLLDALSSTYKATGKRYYISSSEGKIHLKKRAENITQWVLATNANISDYSYTKSIAGIKTRVKVLSKEDTVVHEEVNEALEKKIGRFMDVESMSDRQNEAQIKELTKSIFDEKGKPKRSLNISAMGIIDIIAGGCAYVIIPHLSVKRTFYIDEDTHTFTRNAHTMKLKLNFADDIDSAG